MKYLNEAGRRAFSLILAVLTATALFVPCAMAEGITFRGIPWGSSQTEVEKAMDAEGIDLWVYEDYNMRRWDGIEQQFDWEHSKDIPCGWYSTAFGCNLTVAGYNVHYVETYCVCGTPENGKISQSKDDSIFYIGAYTFDVIDHRAVYEDLKEKLCSIYGECEEKAKNGSGFHFGAKGSGEYHYTERTATWNGDDETSVKLYCYTSDYDDDNDIRVAIYYGKTDMDGYIDSLQAKMKADALQAERDSRSASKDGL